MQYSRWGLSSKLILSESFVLNFVNFLVFVCLLEDVPSNCRIFFGLKKHLSNLSGHLTPLFHKKKQIKSSLFSISRVICSLFDNWGRFLSVYFPIWIFWLFFFENSHMLTNHNIKIFTLSCFVPTFEKSDLKFVLAVIVFLQTNFETSLASFDKMFFSRKVLLSWAQN